jgi:hypothetical protein
MFKLFSINTKYNPINRSLCLINKSHSTLTYSTTTKPYPEKKAFRDLKTLSDQKDPKRLTFQQKQHNPKILPPQKIYQNSLVAIKSASFDVSKFQIKTKQDTLNYFKHVSDTLLADFKKYKFLSSLKYLNRELIQYNGDQPEFVLLKEGCLQNKEFQNSLEYLNANLGEYTPQEKACLFKMLTIVYDKESSDNNNNSKEGAELLRKVLLTLEIDFYNLNLSELNLIDMINYRDGFNAYRERNLQFQKVSTDLIFYQLVDYVEKYLNLQGSPLSVNSPIDKSLGSDTTAETPFSAYFNHLWQLDPFNSDHFYIALNLHSSLDEDNMPNRILSPFVRVGLYITLYRQYFHSNKSSSEIKMGILSKLLQMYFNDRYVSNRINNT